MARRAFYSFHYNPDNWRASKVRNMGIIEKNPLASSNKWEEIKQEGDDAIRRWINANQKGRSIVIVLIGAKTAGRKWVKYEIEEGMERRQGAPRHPPSQPHGPTRQPVQ